jgi:gliding motility-associated-like protein
MKLILTITFILSCFATLYSQQCLRNTGNPNGVLIGDLDISGSQITVEALIYITGAGGPNIVSKHTGPANVNYLLRSTTFELTTSNGFLQMVNPFSLQSNQWYHIAGTYDGSFVRYYVNGCLVIQQAWTGPLVTNNLQACIANISSSPYGEGFNGYIDEVRIWDIARTATQIKQNMTNLLNPTTYPNLRAYYKFEGNYNNVLGTGFNGTALNAPSIIPVTGVLPTEFQLVDVDVTDNVICNGSPTGSILITTSLPLNSSYSLNGTTYNSSNLFEGLTSGTYTVYARNQEGCALSSVVQIQSGTVLDAGTNTSVCPGGTAQLSATGGGQTYTWDANPSLSSTTIPNPVATPTMTTTYTVRSKVRVGPNLVVNGDFEMGNTGFSSGYVLHSTGPFNDGKYRVTNSSPTSIHAGFSNCPDHTTSSGYQLLANGACGVQLAPFVDVWCQTISVTPNTDYEFSAWMQNVVSNLPSSTLLFSINGVPVGNPAGTSNMACVWDEFFVTWNSGSATTANICIAEGTGTCNGNDLAIDDITFYELCELVDNVTVTVNPSPTGTITHSGNVCQNGVSPTVTMTGATGTAPYTFTYTDNLGAQHTLASNASGVATITVPTTSNGTFTYILNELVDNNGCNATVNDTAIVTIYGLPALTASDTSICESGTINLSVSGADTYVWAPATYISSTTGNTVTFTPGLSTTYTITGTDINSCSNTVSLSVAVNSNPGLNVTADTTICNGASVNLQASGASDYSWNQGLGQGSSHTVSPTGTITYQVIGTTAGGCTSSESVTITVNPIPSVTPTVSATSICTNETVNIVLNGPSGTSYNWTVNQTNVTGASNGSGNVISHTLLAPNSNGTVIYTITPTLNGCDGPSQTVTITVNSVVLSTETIAICSYDLPYTWNGQIISSGGNNIAVDTTVNGSGCNVITSLNLIVNNAPAQNFSINAPDCLPATTVFNPINTPSGGTCIWYVDGQQIQGDCLGASHIFQTPGCYDVSMIATDNNGCVNTVSQTNAFCFNDSPFADFSYYIHSNNSVQTVNNSTNATSYEWVSSAGISNQTSPLLTFVNGNSQVVTLFAYNVDGCVDSVSITIEWPLVVPNIITANGDGVNDIFVISGLVENSKLIILNRWGNTIYQSDNYLNNWDGKDKGGRYVSEGVYTYSLETPDGVRSHGFIHVEY